MKVERRFVGPNVRSMEGLGAKLLSMASACRATAQRISFRRHVGLAHREGTLRNNLAISRNRRAPSIDQRADRALMFGGV